MNRHELNVKQTEEMLIFVSEKMVASESVLSHADQVIGDGDHGIGIARGFRAVGESLANKEFEDPASLFKSVGMTLLSTIGGAAGAVFGTLFMGMGAGFNNAATITPENFANAMESGLVKVLERGGAQEGQKTMIDALAPAVRAAKEASDPSLDVFFETVFRAAEAGKEQTKEMVSRIGKSKTLGERSLGYPDPGAITTTLIFQFCWEFVSSHLSD